MKPFLAELLKKFASRKFLAGTIASIFLVLEKKLGFDIGAENRYLLVGTCIAWILGESVIDFKAVKGGIDLQPLLRGLEKIGVDPVELAKKIFAKYADILGVGAAPVPAFTMARPAQDLSEFLKTLQPVDGASVEIVQPGKPDEEAPKQP